MNSNTIKFYSECGVNDLLISRTKSQLKTAKTVRTCLMKMFYDLEKAIITYEHVKVKKYLNMSTAMKKINCAKKVSEHIIALRNYCAHAYSTNDYLKSGNWYRINDEFILDSVKDLIDYLSDNADHTNNYTKYANLLSPYYKALTELFKGEN